jgi:hypothetical protein
MVAQAGELFGEDLQNSALFKFIDNILTWLGFDGIDGYMNEYAAEQYLGPLVQEYETGEKDIAKTKETSYWKLLEQLTTGKKAEQKIQTAAAKVDMPRVYALLSGKDDEGTNWLYEENIHELLPPYEPYASLQGKEAFYAGAAFVMERLGHAPVANPLEKLKTRDLVKWMMLFTADPDKGTKHFVIADAWRSLPDHEAKMTTWQSVQQKKKSPEEKKDPSVQEGEVVISNE